MTLKYHALQKCGYFNFIIAIILPFFFLKEFKGDDFCQRLNVTEVSENLNYIYYMNDFNNSTTIWFPNGSTLLTQPNFSFNKTTIIFLAGFTDQPDSDVSQEIINSYTKFQDQYNVVQLDYSVYATSNLVLAFGSVPCVGTALAQSLDSLFMLGLPSSSIELVGFSLGAQVIGSTVRLVNEQIPYVVGLDPAGPGFDGAISLPSLDAGYANYTLILHTNAGNYGTDDSSGDSNFLPNDGEAQPGCSDFIFETCSHSRAGALWSSAITNPDLFIGVLCDYSDNSNERGACDLEEQVIMTETRASGDFYFQTSSEYPYGLGESGISNANG